MDEPISSSKGEALRVLLVVFALLTAAASWAAVTGFWLAWVFATLGGGMLWIAVRDWLRPRPGPDMPPRM